MLYGSIGFAIGAVFALAVVFGYFAFRDHRDGGTIPTGRQPHEIMGKRLTGICIDDVMPKPPVMTWHEVKKMLMNSEANTNLAIRDMDDRVSGAVDLANIALSCLHVMECWKCGRTPNLTAVDRDQNTGKRGLSIACECTRSEGFNVLETVETWNRLQVSRKDG